MTKVKDLEQDLDSMAKILCAATENFEYFNYLHSPLTPREAHFIEGNNFLKRLRYVVWQMTVIELSKLISPSGNQKFNVFKLIKKFQGVRFKSFNIPDTTIAIWEGSVLKHGNTIDDLNQVRDKLYAHSDRGVEDLEQKSFHILNIRELIHDLQILLNFIAESTIGKKYEMPELYYLRTEFDFIKKLSE